jgi:PPOX class probable F420-dependent enzyme
MTDTTTRNAVLPETVREFLAATRFATIATIDPDGSPRQAVTWYRLDGDEIVLNSKVGRRWPTNLVRDPRISIAVSATDADRWVGLTGIARVITDRAAAQADVAEMARRYHADEPEKAERLIRGQFQREERISFRITALALHDHQE